MPPQQNPNNTPEKEKTLEESRQAIIARQPRNKHGVRYATLIKTPQDYFEVHDNVPRLVLRFDFDSAIGKETRDKLIGSSRVYVDRHDELGPEDGFDSFLNLIENEHPEDGPILISADELNAWLMSWVDYEFMDTFSPAADLLIVSCVTPDARQKEHYLIEIADFIPLAIPSSLLLPLPN